MIFNKGEKILVRIKTPIEQKVKRRMGKDGVVIVVPGKKKKNIPQWKFTVKHKHLFYSKGFLGKKILTVDIIPDADEPIPIIDNLKPEDVPAYDKQTATKFVDAKIMEKRGIEPKGEGRLIQYITALLGAINIALVVVLLTQVF